MLDELLTLVSDNLEDSRYAQVRVACAQLLFALVHRMPPRSVNEDEHAIKRRTTALLLLQPHREAIEGLLERTASSTEAQKSPEAASIATRAKRLILSVW